ncbi:uncharacterized protein N7496_002797 [Penicillium cataractarum]|uniref:Superoxide dismutase [Cu-Zn] n=1 Tax=Penicillium cataractarum TaxID=2100454 RepID=A0A9W9SMG7_9EURO|nr:uncharacterized protein N7496_002797 [Penicillium cataractarum]KAJ5380369.1 hypothetical protein N7496_002797 [Penicillium cataractarum]
MLPNLFYVLPAVLAMSLEVTASIRATAVLEGQIEGTLAFEEREDGLFIEGELSNLTFGLHGIHIHEFGKTGNGCADAGGHYNPTNVDHGAPDDEVRHVGDFGNIDVTASPYRLSFNDRVATLNGPYTILDRSIVIHSGADDLGKGNNPNSKKNGNSGSRLACGVIQEV